VQANRGGSKGAGRAGALEVLNDSPVGCALRSAASGRPRTATVRHGYSTCVRAAVGRLVTQRAAAAAAAGQRASDNDGEREERHGAAEAEGGVGWRGLVDSDGAPLLKATSTMEGVGAVGLTSTRNPWTAPRPPRA
jgi:hypothetical protein